MILEKREGPKARPVSIYQIRTRERLRTIQLDSKE